MRNTITRNEKRDRNENRRNNKVFGDKELKDLENTTFPITSDVGIPIKTPA